jgi:hypothetical protein
MFSPDSLFCLAERRSDGLERKKGTQHGLRFAAILEPSSKAELIKVNRYDNT